MRCPAISVCMSGLRNPLPHDCLLPQLLRVLEHCHVRPQVIAGRGLDARMSQSAAHDGHIHSGSQSARRPRVTQVLPGHERETLLTAPSPVAAVHLPGIQAADKPARPAVADQPQTKHREPGSTSSLADRSVFGSTTTSWPDTHCTPRRIRTSPPRRSMSDHSRPSASSGLSPSVALQMSHASSSCPRSRAAVRRSAVRRARVAGDPSSSVP